MRIINWEKPKQHIYSSFVNNVIIIYLLADAELSTMLNTKGGQHIENLLHTSLVGGAPTCEIVSVILMSALRE